MSDKASASPPAITATAKKNIATVAQLEQELLRQRSRIDRVSDAVTRFVGSIKFVVAHVIWFSGWLLINTGRVGGVRPFDPYPFNFLGLMVGLEAIFLSTFVLMSQNRQRRHTEHWDHLELQISLLSEQEMTKMLQMLQTICDALGLEKTTRDRELKEMVRHTPVEVLAQELERARGPDEPTPPGPPAGPPP
jgi:uncharacterized membrane protein